MQQKPEEKELGFGTKTATQRTRLINKDGSFNIDRVEVSKWQSVSIYHALITMSWRRFNFFVFLYFIIINLIFACCYLIAGIDGLIGVQGTTLTDRFLEAFSLVHKHSAPLVLDELVRVITSSAVLQQLNRLRAYLGLLWQPACYTEDFQDPLFVCCSAKMQSLLLLKREQHFSSALPIRCATAR